MKTWAIANQKGGVGKTTTTITLAGILADHGEKTLMVDLDPHGSLSSYFGVDPETVKYSAYDLIYSSENNNRIDINHTIQHTSFDNLSLMPASTALATLEKKLGSRPGMGLVLSHELAKLNRQYSYILIDCPPMLGMLMVSALAACENLIIPVQTEYLAIKGLQRMLRTLSMIEKTLLKNLPHIILPTMYDERTLASRKSLQQILSDYSDVVSPSVIPIDTKFRDASHAGRPLSHMYPKTHGVLAYAEFLTDCMYENNSTKKAAM